MNNKVIGNSGEALAADYLDREGYEILERGFRCPRGEVDIIAYKGDTLHFVEVKTRCGKGFGEPKEAVDEKKLERMYKTASFYLLDNGEDYGRYSFDVIEIKLNHIREVF